MRRFVKLKALILACLMAVAGLVIAPSIAKIGGFALPEWITQTFTRQFKLGLDLQGGLHLEYSVAVDEALENKLDRVSAELDAAFREKKDLEVEIERMGVKGLKIRLPSPEDMPAASDDVLGVAYGLLERKPDEVGEEGEDEGVIVLEIPEQNLVDTRKAIVGQALDTVRRRVDAMGVAEPNIYPKNRSIVIELPGMSDKSTELRAAGVAAAEQLAGILRTDDSVDVRTRELRADPGAFTLTLPDQDARDRLREVLGDRLSSDWVLSDDRVGAQFQVLEDDAGATPDPSSVTLALTERARDAILQDSNEFRRLLDIIERAAVLEMHMVDDETPFGETGQPYLRALYEANLVRQGMGIAVNVDADDYGGSRSGPDVKHVKEPYYFQAKERETLERFFAELPPQWQLPPAFKIAYGKIRVRVRKSGETEELWRTHIIKSRADVTGEYIVSANVGFKQDTGVPEVNVKFDRIGADIFDTMSGENIGRKMAIVMDEVVVSDPVFQSRIPNGSVVITLGNKPGKSIREEANGLVKVLKSGSLPARLQKEFEIRVGADLGADSVARSFEALVIGLAAVVVFMGVYYRRSGLIAVVALLQNMLLVLAAMSLFRATLTLPGMAGIVLTIGMAVDANVIIFERVREYLREGYTARAAIEAGYERAFTTILDSQLTTAIAGIVLWQYGSGPIRGFAITLLIGIATSIFSGVFTTRVFFDWQANRRGFDRVSI
ncbi:MAG: protein translocase subunit SecD [Myxococcales bacterium FL481]|nr:MAG: protein translocase subunit SecD [Myxococcales bacterium FL481]